MMQMVMPMARTNDLNRTLKLAKRAKNKGLKVLLDFHYSDFWVDLESKIFLKLGRINPLNN